MSSWRSLSRSSDLLNRFMMTALTRNIEIRVNDDLLDPPGVGRMEDVGVSDQEVERDLLLEIIVRNPVPIFPEAGFLGRK